MAQVDTPDTGHELGVLIRGVDISFPFSQYPGQRAFMDKLITACQKQENALLESPTGTGKTLSLLCAALGWQMAQRAALDVARAQVSHGAEPLNSEGALNVLDPADTSVTRLSFAAGVLSAPPVTATSGKASSDTAIHIAGRTYTYRASENASQAPDGTPAHVPITSDSPAADLPSRAPLIIYSSRTHSQLSQVARELQRTAYAPKVALLASRAQLCVHAKVKELKGGIQSSACRALCKARACGPRTTLNDFLNNGGEVWQLPLAKTGTPAAAPASAPVAASFLPRGGANAPASKRAATSIQLPAGISKAKPPVPDVEDLVKIGQDLNVCPYFAQRWSGHLAGADVILLPYNYLVDPATRAGLSVDWQNAVIIFDEAHNVESNAGEAASFDLSVLHLSQAVRELRAIIEAGVSAKREDSSAGVKVLAALDSATLPNLQHVADLQAVLRDLAAALADVDAAKEPQVYDGAYIYSLLTRWNITFATKDMMITLLDSCIEWLHARGDSIALAAGGAAGAAGAQAAGLEQVRSLIARVYQDESTAEELTAWYKVLVHDVPARQGSVRTLSYWCMSPGVVMAELKSLGVRSIVLTSGTLSPLSSYAAELRLPFPHRLENPHVIEHDQLLVSTLTKGPGDVVLNSSYANRSSPRYMTALGELVHRVAANVPHGLLVFFTTYAVMNATVQFWEQSGLKARIDSTKPILVEPRPGADPASSSSSSSSSSKAKPGQVDHGRVTILGAGLAKAAPPAESSVARAGRGGKDPLGAVLARFRGLISSRSGAILCAVCRGKASEGIDFADDAARAVIVTGLPFPPTKDIKVVLKRKHLDSLANARSKAGATAGSHSSSDELLTGAAWYSQQAARAVNQAAGRVIRHRSDWGVVILADERFAQPRAKQQLSKWLLPHLRDFSSSATLVDTLRHFVSHATAQEGVRKQAAAAASARQKARNSLHAIAQQAKDALLKAELQAAGASASATLSREALAAAGVDASLPSGLGESLPARSHSPFAVCVTGGTRKKHAGQLLGALTGSSGSGGSNGGGIINSGGAGATSVSMSGALRALESCKPVGIPNYADSLMKGNAAMQAVSQASATPSSQASDQRSKPHGLAQVLGMPALKTSQTTLQSFSATGGAKSVVSKPSEPTRAAVMTPAEYLGQVRELLDALPAPADYALLGGKPLPAGATAYAAFKAELPELKRAAASFAASPSSMRQVLTRLVAAFGLRTGSTLTMTKRAAARSLLRGIVIFLPAPVQGSVKDLLNDMLQPAKAAGVKRRDR